MKAILKIIKVVRIGVIFLGLCGAINAQTGSEEVSEAYLQKNKELFIKNQAVAPSQIKSIENQVLIAQIGNQNKAFVTVPNNTKTSLDVLQKGDNNYLFSYKDAKSVKQKIQQEGYSNVILDYGKNKSIDVNQSFYQKGTKLNIINTGINSISKDMTIQQMGVGKTISIINL
jgi:hypothetical protein